MTKQPPANSKILNLTDKEPTLLFALQELIRTDGINFDEWWDEFKRGFIGGKRDKKSNFQPALWTKPKYSNLTPIDSKSGAMTIEYWPDNDKLEESYLLSGTVGAVIKSIMDIMREKTKKISFETWFQAWELGFSDFKENRANSNFLLSGDKRWERIKDPKTRPRYKEWTTLQQQIKLGYKVIEYWRDRSLEGNSVILSGSDLQLIQHIIQIEYEGNAASGSNKNKNWPPMKGQPTIKLYFRGESRAVTEITLKIMNKSDDPKIPLPSIDKSDLRNYARKIKEQFATPDLFVWSKGKEILSYKNRWQGFDGQWWLCRNEAAGMNLLKRLLGVLDLTIDTSRTRMSTALDEAAAFPMNPPDITVLGQTVKQQKKRPLIDVTFWRAEIQLAKLPTPIALVERAAIVYD